MINNKINIVTLAESERNEVVKHKFQKQSALKFISRTIPRTE
jgi:hypothetical protein